MKSCRSRVLRGINPVKNSWDYGLGSAEIAMMGALLKVVASASPSLKTWPDMAKPVAANGREPAIVWDADKSRVLEKFTVLGHEKLHSGTSSADL